MVFCQIVLVTINLINESIMEDDEKSSFYNTICEENLLFSVYLYKTC